MLSPSQFIYGSSMIAVVGKASKYLQNKSHKIERHKTEFSLSVL